MTKTQKKKKTHGKKWEENKRDFNVIQTLFLRVNTPLQK